MGSGVPDPPLQRTRYHAYPLLVWYAIFSDGFDAIKILQTFEMLVLNSPVLLEIPLYIQ